MASKREQLVALLDEKVFDPILHKSDSNLSEADRKKLADLQKSTETEKQRFHKEYTSAEDVKKNYQSDLSSHTSEKKDKEAEKLGLPKMSDARDAFEQLCDKLNV